MKKNALSVKQFVQGAFSSSRCYTVSMSLGEEEEAEQSGFPREGTSGVSHGLNSALAGRGVILKEKAFHNLKPFELQRKVATTAGWTRLGIYRKREMKKNALVKQFVKGAFSSSRCYTVSMSLGEEEDAEQSGFPREGSGVSHGLNSALAGRGVIVKDKAFHNLKPYELQRKGATTAESLTGLPVHVRGNVVEGGASEISKGQFGKLLKQVTTHISSIPSVYVHDGAVGPPSKCDAKIRVISDSPSAVLSLARILWKTPTRAVSHDSSPVTVYVATDISRNTREIIGLGSQSSIGFLAADIERSSLILCGKAFLDTNGVKDTLAAVAGPIISAREGIPLSARLVVIGDSVILLFAPENVIKSFSKLLVSTDVSVVLSSNGVSPMFQCGDSDAPTLLKMPAALILGCADSSSTIPSASKLSPGQAVYHFLAGYQNGNFVPSYSKRPSALDSLELAKALLSKLKDNQIPSFLININEGEKLATGNELVKLVQSTLSSNIAPFEPKAGDLQKKYKSFISRKFQELPHEFSF